MKLIVLFSLFGAIFAIPSGSYYFNQPSYPAAPMPVSSVTGNLNSFHDTNGAYKFSYSQSDGQLKEESTSADGGITGQYSYVNPDGQQITVSYVAGKDGFRASGNHLPLAPQLPADLAQAYAEANERLRKAHEEARSRTQTYEDGSYKYQPDKFPAAPQPILYNTYVSAPVYAVPAKNSYTYEAPAYPEPKPVYSSSSYYASVGGEAKPYSPTPAVVPVQYQPIPPKVKSAYEGKSY
ncbi:hypothetical protein CHUAL_013482 [Chamberlinius hualienensis]